LPDGPPPFQNLRPNRISQSSTCCRRPLNRPKPLTLCHQWRNLGRPCIGRVAKTNWPLVSLLLCVFNRGQGLGVDVLIYRDRTLC
jgi:hypothetical protein